MSTLDSRLVTVADAAIAEGFQVFHLDNERRPNGFFYACKTLDGSFVVVGVPTHKWDDLDVSAPVTPNKEYGSGVMVDHNGTTESIIEAMNRTCDSVTVLTRFVPNPKRVPNFGRKCLDRFPGGSARFVKYAS